MAYHTIKLKNYSNVFEEYEANAEIYPGHLVELMSTGKIRKHASANSYAMPMFALEDYLQGKTVDDAYATGDQVQVWIPGRGDQVYARLQDAQNIAIGDALVSSGDGTLKKADTDIYSWESLNETQDLSTRVILAIALEAKDLSGSGSDSSAGGQYYPLIKVRIV